jgi:hypothetical protein
VEYRYSRVPQGGVWKQKRIFLPTLNANAQNSSISLYIICPIFIDLLLILRKNFKKYKNKAPSVQFASVYTVKRTQKETFR